MDENIILNSMQNISDKLDQLAESIDLKTKEKPERGVQLTEKYTTAIVDHLTKTQTDISNIIIEAQKHQIKNIKPIINNKKENYIFGNDTSITSKGLLLIIVLLIIFSNSIKLVPDYLNKKSQITKERNEYKQIYDYCFLNFHDKENDFSKMFPQYLQLAKSKNPKFIKRLNLLKSKYEK